MRIAVFYMATIGIIFWPAMAASPMRLPEAGTQLPKRGIVQYHGFCHHRTMEASVYCAVLLSWPHYDASAQPVPSFFFLL